MTDGPPKTPKLLTREQLAAELNISANHVTDLTHEGMPAYDLGTVRRSVYRYDLPKVLAWLEARRARNDRPTQVTATSRDGAPPRDPGPVNLLAKMRAARGASKK